MNLKTYCLMLRSIWRRHWRRHPQLNVEHDIQLNVLTPNSMILGRDMKTINSNADGDSDEWTKRQRYIRCKENAWKRWKHEYLVTLQERHNLSHKDRKRKVKISDIVMIKDEWKNRGHWKIGKVSQLYVGKDEVVRAVQMQVGTKFLVRPIQLLHPFPSQRGERTRREQFKCQCKRILAKT